MRLLSFRRDDGSGLAIERSGELFDLSAVDAALPTDIAVLLRLDAWRERVDGAARTAPLLDRTAIAWLPPLQTPEKILCVGLNYVDHAGESRLDVPTYPVFFARFASTLVGHQAPLVRPASSDSLDYEGELVAVIGRAGRHIAKSEALAHVAGYTIFNEASVRMFQFKSSQWTMGKNFDDTGACGPVFVTADELPPGAQGIRVQTCINGAVEQDASTADMIFDVATLVSLASDAMTLRPGDMIVTGTPAGVGLGKSPPVYLQPGDLCTISIEGIGTLENRVIAEPARQR